MAAESFRFLMYFFSFIGLLIFLSDNKYLDNSFMSKPHDYSCINEETSIAERTRSFLCKPSFKKPFQRNQLRNAIESQDPLLSARSMDQLVWLLPKAK